MSDIRLEPEAESLLKKGLNFAITPKCVPTDEFITATEVACRQLKQEAADSLRSDIVKTLRRFRKPPPNLTLEERKALQNLKNKKEIMIIGSDKGRATVVMNTKDYKDKILDLLQDKDTYELLKKDPTNGFKTKLINMLRKWKNDKAITDKLYYKLYPTSDLPPRFYGLPKIHKNNVPLRPIVSSIGNITYGISKFLTQVLSPLVGKTKHFIKNSRDFVEKIAQLEVPPGRKMVSYDVTALFTSIPVEQAIKVIEARLRSDPTLNQRCELNVDQVLSLLSFCLTTTYFVYDKKFYKQKHGAAMGSSVSPVVANLYMEDFEEKALASAPNPPYVWMRYVDDTFVVLHEYDIDNFTSHINSIDPNIQFTIEPEQDGSIPFLDTKIILNDDASIDTKVYRKPTHTDQYLNWNSNHHLEHKRSVVRSLVQRAETIPSTEEYRKEEMEHVKKALAANGYQSWILKIPKKKERNTNTAERSSGNRIPSIALPYIKGLSENVQRIFRTYNIPTYHKPFNTLRSALVKPKDTIPKEDQCGLVYHIKCGDCNHTYIGETGRNIGTRFKEHTSRKGTNSAVKEHLEASKHTCSLEEVKILEKEDDWYRRKVKEAIMIKRHQPTLNRDKGLELPPVYTLLLSHDPHGSCDSSAPTQRH